MILGIITTFVCFFSFSVLTIWISRMNLLQQYDSSTKQWSSLEISQSECLLLSSILCSVDLVSAISLLKYESQPSLFSIIFGEGLLNDAVSIILFNTVTQYTSATRFISFKTPFNILIQFINNGFISVLYGLLFGLSNSYIFKRFRSLSKNPLIEILFILIFGYFSYIISELRGNSGIISLLVSALIMAQYSWYNLSP